MTIFLILYFLPLIYLIYIGLEEDDEAFKWMWIGCGLLPFWGGGVALIVFLARRNS